jgi:hypothetical protein
MEKRVLIATYNDGDGIVTTTARGMSTSADFDAYLPMLHDCMRKSTAMHGKWLHLVDASDNLVQSRESTEHVSAIWKEAPRFDGYVAYLTTSILAKMQIERMAENPYKGFFADAASARAWLLTQVGAAKRAAA